MKKTIIGALAGFLGALAAFWTLGHFHVIHIEFADHAEDGHKHESASHRHGEAEKKTPSPAGDAHAEEGEGASVTLSEKQKNVIGVKLAAAVAGSLDNFIRLSGEIQLNMDRTARIMPQMPGFVTEIMVSEGSRVKKGQVLARITSHKLGEYYSSYNSAKELEKVTKSELEMAQTLFGQNGISRKDFLRYQRDHMDAVIAREKAELQLKSLSLPDDHSAHRNEKAGDSKVCTEYEIQSPFDGIVLQKDITVGENFAEDNTKVIFVVSDLSQLWVDLQANDSEATLLKTGMPVEIAPAGFAKTYSGTIAYVAPVIDRNTRTALARVLLDNKDGLLKAGFFAVGTVRAGSVETSVVVPAESVQLVGGETVMFVPAGGGYKVRDVKTGNSEKGYTVILSGLKAGEQYVSAGAFELKSVILARGMTGHQGHGH